VVALQARGSDDTVLSVKEEVEENVVCGV